MASVLLRGLQQESVDQEIIMKPEFLDETIRVWQPHYTKTLTREDAREITENLAGFYRILVEWQEKQTDRKSHLKRKAKE